MDTVLAMNSLSSRQAAQLRGKLAFAESHCFSRWTRFHRCVLMDAPPRTVKVLADESNLMIFTDGAVEGTDATFAGTLIEPNTSEAQFFDGKVPDAVMQAWSRAGVSHLVAFTKRVPILIARSRWSDRLLHKPVVWFTDWLVVVACELDMMPHCVVPTLRPAFLAAICLRRSSLRLGLCEFLDCILLRRHSCVWPGILLEETLVCLAWHTT
eukprot:2108516-Amphidinium_carterae.1